MPVQVVGINCVVVRGKLYGLLKIIEFNVRSFNVIYNFRIILERFLMLYASPNPVNV